MAAKRNDRKIVALPGGSLRLTPKDGRRVARGGPGALGPYVVRVALGPSDCEPLAPRVPALDLPVSSLADARALVLRWAGVYGGGAWYVDPGVGEVRETASGRVIARVAYNGRVFEPGPIGQLTPEIKLD